MALWILFVAALLCFVQPSLAFETSDPALTAIKYEGQVLPIWESDGRYLVSPWPQMEPNLTRILDAIIGSHGEYKVHLEFGVRFTQDNIRFWH